MTRHLGLLIAFCLACVPLLRAEEPRHAIYLHGRIVQIEQDRRPVHPEFGAYELDEIVASLRSAGFDVSADVRPRDASESESAQRVVDEVRTLLDSGARPEHILVIGASAGGGIALRAAARLQEPEVRFAILGNCLTNLVKRIEAEEKTRPVGTLVSIREESDALTHGCPEWEESRGTLAAREVVIRTGLGHGFLYRPLPEWLDPALSR